MPCVCDVEPLDGSITQPRILWHTCSWKIGAGASNSPAFAEKVEQVKGTLEYVEKGKEPVETAEAVKRLAERNPWGIVKKQLGISDPTDWGLNLVKIVMGSGRMVEESKQRGDRQLYQELLGSR